jgi:hypothetical protein
LRLLGRSGWTRGRKVKRVLFKFRFFSLVFIAVVAGAWPMAAQAAAVGLAGFAVLSAAPGGAGKVTCTTSVVTGPPSTIKGDVGSTGTVVNPLTPGCTITGTTIAPVSTQVVTDFNAAYAALAPKTGDCDSAHTLLSTIGSRTLAPGVYCTGAALTGVTGSVLTLDAAGNANAAWLFKIGTAATGGTAAAGALTGTDFSVVMAGGGKPCNVNWWVAQGATLTEATGTSMPFQGTILAGAAITLTGISGSASDLTLTGRLWARAGVTVTDATISGCTSPITVPPTKCKPGTSTDTDENSDQSKDTADNNKSADRASSSSNGDNNGKNSEGDSDKDAKGCDSENSKQDKSNQEMSKQDNSDQNSKKQSD